MDRQSILNRIKDGKIFSVIFRKANGDERHLVGRLGVKKALKGGSKPFSDEDYNLVTVYDLQKQAYRSFKVDRVLQLKEHGRIHDLRS